MCGPFGGKTETMMYLQIPARGFLQIVGRIEYDQMVPIARRTIQYEDPIQRDPPKKQHHDQFIQRHIRSPQYRDRHSR